MCTAIALRRTRRSLAAILIAAVLESICGLPALAADRAGAEGLALIAQAMRGKHSHTFQAVQEIWFAGSESGPSRMVAELARAGRRTRLVYREPASMAGRVRIDDGTRIYQFGPQSSVLSVDAAPDRGVLAAHAERLLALLGANYRCARVNGQTVNGRACDLVRLSPRRGAGGAYRLCWIDRATQVVLRTEERRQDGSCLYLSFYRSIQFVPRLPAKLWEVPRAARTAAPTRALPRTETKAECSEAFSAAGIEGQAPCWSPCGFRLIDCAVLWKKPSGKAALLHFSDGLNGLSVFEERRTPSLLSPQQQQERLMRALAPRGQQVWVHDFGALHITILGDQTLSPPLGAEMMAALDPQADQRLRQALGRDFGGDCLTRAADLRRLGWGYDQIAALLLCVSSRSLPPARLRALASRGRDWAGVARLLRLPSEDESGKAQQWVASVVGPLE